MRQLREALIGKNNIKNIKARSEIFLVDTFNIFFDYCVNRFKDKLITKKRNGVYLFTKQEIDNIMNNIVLELDYDRTDYDFRIYDLSYISEDEREKIINDINNPGMTFIQVIRKYKLQPTPYSKL